MEVQILPYLNRLTEKTKSGDISWENIGVDTYRLLLRNGSVVFKKEPETGVIVYGQVFFRLKIYDERECFYALDVTSISSEVYRAANELFRTICDEENRFINEKMSALFSEL